MGKHGICVSSFHSPHTTLAMAAVSGEATTDDLTLTLTYFDGPGRAELTRLVLAAGDIE